jgi:hypothetical protein
MISAHFDTRSDETIINALTHDPTAYSLSLGCHGCHHFAACGGLCVKDSLFDCLGLCCNNPDKCTRVCRNAPSVRFADQLREIGGFDFDNVPRAPLVRHQISDDIVPLVYHGSGRVGQLAGSTFPCACRTLSASAEGRSNSKTALRSALHTTSRKMPGLSSAACIRITASSRGGLWAKTVPEPSPPPSAPRSCDHHRP